MRPDEPNHPYHMTFIRPINCQHQPPSNQCYALSIQLIFINILSKLQGALLRCRLPHWQLTNCVLALCSPTRVLLGLVMNNFSCQAATSISHPLNNCSSNSRNTMYGCCLCQPVEPIFINMDATSGQMAIRRQCQLQAALKPVHNYDHTSRHSQK